jgi:carbon storage regulator CsrA
MLVLSRKPDQRIVLPALNIAIKVVEIKRGAVRLGIDAPHDVTVLREEVADRAAEWRAEKDQVADLHNSEKGREVLHQFHERLRTTGVGLALLSLELDAGLIDDAKAALIQIREDLRLLRLGLAGELENMPKPSNGAHGSQKALLVEDDCNQRELLAALLRQSGMDVDTASDGSDALKYLRTHDKPDVVLLDMGLPHVDGPTMVREIRGDPAFAGLKVFGVTGHRPEEFGLDQGPAGIDRWFRKPLDLNILLEHLTQHRDGAFCRA